MYFAYYLTGVIMIPVLIFAFYCQIKVNSTFKKFSNVKNMRGLTGAQAAQQMLLANGITNVSIVPISGNLTDHFNPKTNQICLSQGVYSSTSVAAIGVACHEAGHACQYAQDYAPIKLRSAVIPATQIGSWLGIPLALIGMVINSDVVITVGVVLYALVALFQLITLPVEFNASRRALNAIESNGYLNNNEYNGAKSVLTAAALTYVAALASSLATLLRLFLIMNRRR